MRAANGWFPILKIPLQRGARQGCQGNPGWLAAFADHVQPVVAGGIRLDTAQGRTGQFADPQSGRIPGGQGRRGFTASNNGPENQPFGFLAVGALRGSQSACEVERA